MTERTKGLIFRAAALLMFGALGVAAKLIDAGPIALTFSMRFMGFFVVAFFVWKKKLFTLPSKKILLPILATIVFIILADVFYFAALKRITVANAVFLKFTFPLFIIFFLFIAPRLFHEKPDKRTFLATIIGIAGLAVLLLQNITLDFDVSGTLFAIGSAATLALFILTLKRVLSKILPLTYLFYRYAIAALILSPFVVYGDDFSLNPDQLFILALFGLFFGGIAALLDTEGIKRLSAQEVGTLGYIEPLSATLYAALLIPEIPGIYTLLGGALIIVSGVMIVKLPPQKLEKKAN